MSDSERNSDEMATDLFAMHDEAVVACRAALSEIMTPAGFAFSSSRSTNHLYVTDIVSWSRDDRQLLIGVSDAVPSSATYVVGDKSANHVDFMWAVTGRRHLSEYPGTNDSPSVIFGRLRSDLAARGEVFLQGSVADLRAAAQKATELAAYYEGLSPLARTEVG